MSVRIPAESGGHFCPPYIDPNEVIIRTKWFENLMARGWESKQVEAQIEAAREPQHGSSGERSPDGQETERARQTLLLSRAYIQRRIESSANSRYTEGLTKALEEIDRKLARLSVARDGSSSGEPQKAS
jgi:hypothetical protein